MTETVVRAFVSRVVVLAVLIGTVVACSTPSRVSSDSTTTAEPAAPLATVVADASRPVNVLVIGDGSGISLGGWMYLTAQALAQKFGRPVDLHDWDFDSGVGYDDPPIHVSDGSGAPISIWNASLSRNIEFLTRALPGMTPPEPVDLVITNNGLDIGAGLLAKESVPFLRTLASRYADASVMAILQPAPIEPAELNERMRSNVRDLELSCRKAGFATIDVAGAFDGRPELYDGAQPYPTVDGQRVWSEAVLSAILGPTR